MKESQIKEHAIRNFEKELGQFQVNSDKKEWAKVSPEDVYNLLKEHTGHSKHAAKELLKYMTEKQWTIKATAHEGGKDKNAPLHITVRLKGQTAHHLNCKENKNGGIYLYEITQKPINFNK